MRDDFFALDLLSAGAFAGLPKGKRAKKKMKNLLGLPRRANKSKSKRDLTALLPILAEKVKKPRSKTILEGWPVDLSWPAADTGTPKKLNIQ